MRDICPACGCPFVQGKGNWLMSPMDGVYKGICALLGVGIPAVWAFVNWAAGLLVTILAVASLVWVYARDRNRTPRLTCRACGHNWPKP